MELITLPTSDRSASWSSANASSSITTKPAAKFRTLSTSSSPSAAAARHFSTVPVTPASAMSGCITSTTRRPPQDFSKGSFVPAIWFSSRRREELASTRSSRNYKPTANHGLRSAKRNAVLPAVPAAKHDLRIQRLPVHHVSHGLGRPHRPGHLLHPRTVADRAHAADQARSIHSRGRAEIASAESRNANDGWDPDQRRDPDSDAALGGRAQSLYLDRAVRDVCKWRDRLRR